MSRIEFALFSFHVGLLFLSTFRLSSFKSETENNANFDTVSSKRAATLTPLSKEDKILIKKICKNVNLCSEFLNKGWTKNSINRLVVKFGTIDRRPGSGRSSRLLRTSHTITRKLCYSKDDRAMRAI